MAIEQLAALTDRFLRAVSFETGSKPAERPSLVLPARYATPAAISSRQTSS
jgi:hypothetical protein